MNSIQDTKELNNGVHIPRLGFGVFRIDDSAKGRAALETAIETGYRSFDTATIYGNEATVGEILEETAVPRDELFITTKVWNSDQGFRRCREAFEKSREKLRVEYLDLYLIHWPVAETFVETWRAMEELYEEGAVRAIGVCNFNPEHLEVLRRESSVVPALNQVELHPYLAKPQLRSYCREHGIAVEAWGPLMRGAVTEDATLSSIAAAHDKSPAQIVLRWDLQHDIITIPKSATPSRIRENADIFDFSLSQQEMDEIDALDRNQVMVGPSPDDFEEFFASIGL